MALQASAPGELCGALGRLGYLCAEGGKAKFVAAADLSMLWGSQFGLASLECLMGALSGID